MGKPTIESLTGLIVQNVDTVHGSRISQLHDEGARQVQAVILDVLCQQVTGGDQYSAVGRLRIVLPVATIVQILSALPSTLTDSWGLSYEQVVQLAADASAAFSVVQEREGHSE